MSTTPGDAARLLAVAYAYDSRKPDEARVLAWADALGDLEPDDCVDAIRRHYRHSAEFVMPAHIRRHARDIVEERHRDAHAWRELQPAAGDCVPMPDYVRRQWAEFLASRKLPPDVEGTTDG